MSARQAEKPLDAGAIISRVRLKQIKLSGFKSFVDPTVVEVPSQRVGVVGPNGCGKSNVIDAVRWVLGESRASELRGESMQDVIFSGSSERKPAGRASVELVFDNTETRLTGSWAGYAELSVRRMVSRDGQSTYLINQQVVRRKDVHDLFLGTGLGPRAYAIIGQGTVSRLIEARPDELRVFLEEAAGVSKYKERRRDTENRLSDTRENLVRVDDILRELEGQIARLDQQAEVAGRFRDLEGERDRKQAMLWLLRRDEAQAEQQQITRQLAELQLELESRLTEQRRAEAELERLRAAVQESSDELGQAQAGFYQTGAEVSRLEGEIRHLREARAELQARIQAAIAQAGEAESRAGESRIRQAEAQAEAEGARTRHESLRSDWQLRQAEVPGHEQDLRARVEAFERKQVEVARAGSDLQVTATRQRALEETLGELGERRRRLLAQQQQLRDLPHEALQTLRSRLEQAQTREHESSLRVGQAEEQARERDAARLPAQQALRESLEQVSRVDARMTILRQLQARVQTQGKVRPWLEGHGLAGRQPLWQRLRIEPGWESAVESVLRERVQSLEMDDRQMAVSLLESAPPVKVGFHGLSEQISSHSAQPSHSVPANPSPELVPLARWVHTREPALQHLLADWLSGVFAAESADKAMMMRDRLPPGGRFVLPSGHVVGRYSIQLHAMDSEQDGVLARQQELDSLEREHRALELLAEQARQEAGRAESAAAAQRQTVLEARDAHGRAVREAGQLRVEVERLSQQLVREEADRERLVAALTELEADASQREAQRRDQERRFAELQAEHAGMRQALEGLRQEREAAQSRLSASREALRVAELAERDAAFLVREAQTRQQTLQAAIEQADRVAEQARAEENSLTQRLASLDEAPLQQSLQQALAQRLSAEARLADVRDRHESLAGQQRTLEEARLGHERAQEPLRARSVELQLREQAARLGVQQNAEQLLQAEVDEAAVRATFETPPRPSWLQAEVNRLAQAIASLGPVNLAALDELESARTRKGFLDSQLADLNEAIATLEDAIRKIDQETRSLLQETYDTVNRHFGLLFPELFGGGEARLVLTGEEILDAGIQVVAHPPGKRNTSIHLLSGGEKALTAIALVFALFQLNPAPFCLLDEVDAPLDDANTERYCAMVKRMSDQTQFLFITHNKIAMELAQQLVGVTMQERGVSRIVAVDLEAAATLAEAA